MTDSENPKNNAGDDNSEPIDNRETKSQLKGSSAGELLPHHPKQIGKYKLRRVIASGGMGTVFEAVQEDPRRSVAIKVIKKSDVSEKAASRLKYEAQMLARLRHPGIAEIYEAGTYEENGEEFPFFAMEYIPNAKTITDFANRKKLTIDQRLELFLQVCDAVNFGHQRGIVHRDLKPDNILVDSHNKVRVIDFGIARATDSDLRKTNAQTEVGQIVGSLQYMSPEQFEADSSDIDIRSDVYSLGVVLYELLSGSLPYNLDAKKIYEIANIIREKAPLPLSKSGTKVAGEIDIILQKALRKEREMRYQTAYGLLQDISRYLSGDAIVARSPSLSYQVKIFARKNKLMVGSLATVFILLITGVIVISSLLVSERAEAEKAKKAREFLTEVFETAIPKGYSDQIPISRLLDKSTKMIEGAFPEDPETEADIKHAIGRGFMRQGNYKEAKEHFNYALSLRREFLGESHPKTISSLEELNTLYNFSGEFGSYLDNCRELCRIDSLSYGPNDENTISSQLSVISALERNGQITEALKLAKETREFCLREYPDNIKLGIRANRLLAWNLLQSGSIDEAEKLARTTFETATTKIEDGWYAKSSKSVLAAALIAQGKLEEATELYGNFPTYPDLDREYDIQGSFNPDESDVHLIIFWEEWCPHCFRVMSRAEDLYRQYNNYGIDIVGITNLWGDATREKCEKFLSNRGITFPIIKEGGKAYTHFDGKGVPSVRLVYKGKLIWDRRHLIIEPISRHMIEGIIKAIQTP